MNICISMISISHRLERSRLEQIVISRLRKDSDTKEFFTYFVEITHIAESWETMPPTGSERMRSRKIMKKNNNKKRLKWIPSTSTSVDSLEVSRKVFHTRLVSVNIQSEGELWWALELAGFSVGTPSTLTKQGWRWQQRIRRTKRCSTAVTRSSISERI